MAPASKQANGEPAKAEVEGPVLAVLSKRLRNLKKRLRNADEIQAKRDSGKELNADQVGAVEQGGASQTPARPPGRSPQRVDVLQGPQGSHRRPHAHAIADCSSDRPCTACDALPEPPPAPWPTHRSLRCPASPDCWRQLTSWRR